MKPATIDADMSNVDGQPVTGGVGEVAMRRADSGGRGGCGGSAEWNHKAIVCADGHVILDIHEWEGDDTDYEQETELYGAVYYTVLALKDSTFVEYDGGTFQYEKDTDLFDFLSFALPQVIQAAAWSRGAIA